jgi:hypothetical protein
MYTGMEDIVSDDGRFYQEGGGLYSLQHDGWRKGVETFRNRISITFNFSSDVEPQERQGIIQLVQQFLNGKGEK